MLTLATAGVGFLWMMLAVVGAFQAGHHENSAFPMVVYYSPWYVIGLWLVKLIIFLSDMFGKNDRDEKRIGRLLFGVVTVAVITTAAVIMIGGGNSQSPSIHDAAAKGNIEAVKQHLADGADVNLKMSFDGATALNHAAWHGHMEIIQLLLENGANANAKRNDGWAPLHDAVYKGHKEIVELLIANGADMNAKFDGKTPLDLVVGKDSSREKAMSDLLRKHGGKTGEELKAEGK